MKIYYGKKDEKLFVIEDPVTTTRMIKEITPKISESQSFAILSDLLGSEEAKRYEIEFEREILSELEEYFVICEPTIKEWIKQKQRER